MNLGTMNKILSTKNSCSPVNTSQMDLLMLVELYSEGVSHAHVYQIDKATTLSFGWFAKRAPNLQAKVIGLADSLTLYLLVPVGR